MRKMALAMTPALLLVGLIGCGGGGDKNDKSTAPAAGAGAAKTVNVSETDFKLSPSDPKVAQGMVTFKATNDGKLPHSIEIEGPNGEAKLAKQLDPGQSGTLKVNMSKPGKYEWYCPVDGHKGKGMKGEITVAAGGTGSAGGSSTSQGGGGGDRGY